MAEHKLKGLNGKVLSLKNNNYLTKDKSVIYLNDVTDFNVNTAEGLEVGSIAHVSGKRGGTFELGSGTAIHDGGVNFHGWKRQYDGAVNVKWFGAKCTGYSTEDDTQYIQAAINSISTEGGVVVIPSGVSCYISSTIIMSTPYVTLKGEGNQYLKGSRLISDVDIEMVSLQANGASLENITLVMDTLTGSAPNVTVNSTKALVVVGNQDTNYDGISVKNCHVSGGYHGINIFSMNCVIKNNLFSKNYQQIKVTSTTSYDSRNRLITENIVHNGLEIPDDNTEVWGILIDANNYQDSILDNQIDGSWLQGGIKYLGHNSIIANNRFRYNRGEADVLIGGFDNLVTGNSSISSYGSAYMNIGNSNVVSNNIARSAQFHAFVDNPSHTDASSNTNLCQYIGNSAHGCGLDDSADYDGFNLSGQDTILMGNTSYSNGRYGVRVESGAVVSVGINQILSNTKGQLSSAGTVKYAARNEYGTSAPALGNVSMELIVPNSSNGLQIGNSTNQKISFYGSDPIAKQNDVAVSVEDIHAALVNLGLIGA